MNKEIRRVSVPTSRLTVRSRTDGTRTLSGYAIVFDSPSEDLGGFIEFVKPQAVNLSKYENVFALRGHDSNKQLASTASGTLKLTKDSRGIEFEFELPSTSDGNDLAELYRVGGQNLGGQCSFGFIANDDAWTLAADGVTVKRYLLDINLFEISVGVISPAYLATTADTRNAPEWVKRKLAERDAVEYCQHAAEERTGVTCSTCSSEVIDDECRCKDASLRSWTCDDCGLSVADTDQDGDTSSLIEGIDDEGRALLMAAIMRQLSN